MATRRPSDQAPAGPDEAGLAEIRAAAWRRTEALRADFAHDLDLAYGDHPRQRIDCYLPAGRPVGPVLAFVHGGGFRTGDHASVAYHGRPYLDAGAVFATIGYRVVPDLRFPDMVEDIENGLAFLVDRLGALGGDPGRVFLSGHSAGATLAALAAMRPEHPAVRGLVRGLVLISGMYDFTSRTSEDTDTDSPRYVPRLTEAIDVVPEHTVVVTGEHDLAFAAPDAAALVAAIEARRGSVEAFVEAGADHFQANRTFVEPGGQVASAVVEMMGLA